MRSQQPLSENATLEGLKLEYDVARAELAKPIRELQGLYQEQLIQLRDEIKASGDLDKTLAVQKELDTFRDGITAPAGKEIPKLRDLQSIYLKEFSRRFELANRKLPEVVKAHQASLDLLQRRLTTQGKLEDAIKVKTAMGEMDKTLGDISTLAAGKSGSSELAEIEWDGLTSPFEVGALQFPNRDNVWLEVPGKYKGWRMSMPAADSKGPPEVQLKTAGLVYAVMFSTYEESFQKEGWETIETLLGSGSGRQEYKLMRKEFKRGKQTLPSAGSFFGTRLVLPPPSQKE